VKARAGNKLRGARRILLEGHPLPMQRYKKLVYGNTMLVGDAGGMVAHTSGEGIYFAMASDAWRRKRWSCTPPIIARR
jgi:geranylgeranyl reductase